MRRRSLTRHTVARPSARATRGRTSVMLLATLAFLADSLMGPGVSRALADYRAARVADVRYDLRLDLTQRDTVHGTVVVRFRRTGPGDVILDFRGPTLVGAAGVEWNRAHVRLPAATLVDGENAVTLRFTALVAPA